MRDLCKRAENPNIDKKSYIFGGRTYNAFHIPEHRFSGRGRLGGIAPHAPNRSHNREGRWAGGDLGGIARS